MAYENYKDKDEFASYLISITSLEQFWREKEPHPDDAEDKAEALDELDSGEPLEEVLLNLQAKELRRFISAREPEPERADAALWSKPDASSDKGLFQNVIYSGEPDLTAPVCEPSLLSSRPISLSVEAGYQDTRTVETMILMFPDQPRLITMSSWHWDALALATRCGLSLDDILADTLRVSHNATANTGIVLEVEKALTDLIAAYKVEIMSAALNVPNDNKLPDKK